MASSAWDALQQILPSDVLRALSNNLPLTIGTLQSARALRGHPASLSSAVQKRIQDIERTMVILQQEKEKLSEQDYARTAMEEAYAALCAPIRCLPADILREIALYSVDDYPSPTRNRAPMNLAHVSSIWRSVVLSSPQFWTTLYLRVRTTDYDHLVQRIQAADTWLRRAAPLPLRLFLYVDCKIGSENDAAYNFNFFLKALGRWAPRVQRLGIGGRNWVNLMANFVDISWDLSDLEQLDILGQRALDSDDMQEEMDVLGSLGERINLFQSAKQLTSIIASQDMIVYFPSFGFLPWNQIRVLSLSEDVPGGLDLETLLTTCRELRSASLSWYNCYPEDLLDLRAHKIRKLEKLQLTNIFICNYTELGRFFTKISFPCLTQLAISIGGMHEHPPEHIPTFNSISLFPALMHLSLEGDTQLPTDFVLQFLRKTPQLRTFSMDFSFHQDDRLRPARPDLNKICDAMTVDHLSDFLPLLEECIFHRRIGTGVYLLDVTLISRFIHSRTQQSAPDCTNLRKITFMGPFGFMTDLHEEVASLSLGKPSVEVVVLPRRINWPHEDLRFMDLHISPFSPKICHFNGPLYEKKHNYSLDDMFRNDDTFNS